MMSIFGQRVAHWKRRSYLEPKVSSNHFLFEQKCTIEHFQGVYVCVFVCVLIASVLDIVGHLAVANAFDGALGALRHFSKHLGHLVAVPAQRLFEGLLLSICVGA